MNPNDAITSINITQIKQSEFFTDKMLERAKFDRLKTIILKRYWSIKDIKVLIRNELLQNKYTLTDRSSDEIYKKEIKHVKRRMKK